MKILQTACFAGYFLSECGWLLLTLSKRLDGVKMQDICLKLVFCFQVCSQI